MSRIFDFAEAGAARGWTSLGDPVMGGVSTGVLRAGDGEAAFEGEVSLAHGGGFASVRSPVLPAGLAGCRALRVRLRGDGRRYKINLVCAGDPYGVVRQAALAAPEAAWAETVVPFASCVAQFRGRVLPDQPALAPERIRQIGLAIGERQAGPFRLRLAFIDAF